MELNTKNYLCFPSYLYTSAMQTTYPNPVEDQLTIEYIVSGKAKDRLTIEYIVSGKASVNTIYIFDIQGRLVQSQSVPEQMGVVEINVQNLSQGSYILSFDKNQAGGLSKKFVVE